MRLFRLFVPIFLAAGLGLLFKDDVSRRAFLVFSGVTLQSSLSNPLAAGLYEKLKSRGLAGPLNALLAFAPNGGPPASSSSRLSSPSFARTQSACVLHSDEPSSCDLTAVEGLNLQHVHPLLSQIVRMPFFQVHISTLFFNSPLPCPANLISYSKPLPFRHPASTCGSHPQFFKVDLHCDCPFWPEDSMCTNRDCSVCECSDDEVPAPWRTESGRGVPGSPALDANCGATEGQGTKEAVVDRTIDALGEQVVRASRCLALFSAPLGVHSVFCLFFRYSQLICLPRQCRNLSLRTKYPISIAHVHCTRSLVCIFDILRFLHISF